MTAATTAQPVPPALPVPPAPPLVRLVRARIRDFRGIEDAVLDLGETTLLMGENNVGKSALLEALDIAIGDRSAATTDLRIAAGAIPAVRFVIDLELSPWTGTAFDQTVVDLLGATLRPEPGTGRQRYFVRAIAEPDETKRAMRIRRGFVNDWDTPVTQAFLSDLSVIHRRSLWFSLLDAKRDLSDDLRLRASPWGKLLRRLQLDEPTRQRFEQQLAALSAQVAQALPDTVKLSSAMSRLQSVLAGQISQARLTLLPQTLNDLWRTTDLLVQAAGHPELSIRQQGMGARSLSAILAFRAWLDAEIAVSAEAPVMIITAFEEPESHLHPQAQRAVFSEIGAVVGQRLLSTHSPYLASVAQLDDFRVVRRNPTVTIRSAHGISKDQSMTPKGLVNVRRFCLRRNGDMVFARVVILGEGDTEAGVLPELARAWWGEPPEARGVAIVPMDGVGNARTFAGFLERLGIPWIVLVDGDTAGLDERAQMAAVPLLAPMVPTRVLIAQHAGAQVDLEVLLAAAGRAAALRALHATDPTAAASLVTASDAAVAGELRTRKATMSTLLGEELARDWSSRSAFPPLLHSLFSLADSLLP